MAGETMATLTFVPFGGDGSMDRAGHIQASLAHEGRTFVVTSAPYWPRWAPEEKLPERQMRICDVTDPKQQRVLTTAQEWAAVRPLIDTLGFGERVADIDARLRAERAERRAREIRQTAAHNRRQAAWRALAEDKGTLTFLRYGTPPQDGRSYNHRDNVSECGVSVYPAWRITMRRYIIDWSAVDIVSAMCIAEGRDLYEVTGDVCGTGSDGEPLLTDCTARKLRRNVIVNRYVGEIA